MKPFTQKLILTAIIFGGLFIGIVRGQEARTRWISKMKSRQDEKKSKLEKKPHEVILDDFEIASFHRN
jgi:hypothetical protein